MKTLIAVLTLITSSSIFAATNLPNVVASNIKVKASIPTAIVLDLQSEQRDKSVDHDESKKSKNTPTFNTPLSKTQAALQSEALHPDFWFHDSWLTLRVDRDYDGYASEFTLTMDADTHFAEASVFALVYLGQNGHFTSFYETSDFRLFGDNSNDEINLDIELLTGYPARDYDVLIELYDAYDNTLLTYVTASDDADLAYQPLESRNFDVEYLEQTVVVEHHGGAFGFGLALLLSLVLGARYRNTNL